jgi:hypothetical protein
MRHEMVKGVSESLGASNKSFGSGHGFSFPDWTMRSNSVIEPAPTPGLECRERFHRVAPIQASLPLARIVRFAKNDNASHLQDSR